MKEPQPILVLAGHSFSDACPYFSLPPGAVAGTAGGIVVMTLLHLLHPEGGDPAQDRSPERAIEQRAEVGLSGLPAWCRLWGAQSAPRQVIEEIADADATRSRRTTTHQPSQEPAKGIGAGASAS